MPEVAHVQELARGQAHADQEEELDGADPADSGRGGGAIAGVEVLVDSERVGVAKGPEEADPARAGEMGSAGGRRRKWNGGAPAKNGEPGAKAAVDAGRGGGRSGLLLDRGDAVTFRLTLGLRVRSVHERAGVETREGRQNRGRNRRRSWLE